MNNQYIETILDKYFTRNNVFTIHQIDSYNDLIDNILPQIISQTFPINIDLYNEKLNNIKINIINIRIERPYYTENNGCRKIMTPNIARLRNFTYSLSVIVDIGIIYNLNENDIKITTPVKNIENILLCKIPIITKSKYCVYKDDIHSECKYDPGGYCIINGNEKVLITQEKIIPNIIQIYSQNKITSKYSYTCEVRSCPKNTFGITKTTILKITNKSLSYNNKLFISFPRLKSDIPICVLFRALGCLTDKEILYHIIDNDNSYEEKLMIKLIHSSLLNNENCHSENDSIEYISKYVNHTNINHNKDIRIEYCKSILNKDLLPHLGNSNCKKIKYLGYMCNRLLKTFLGLLEPSNRDNYDNKRIEPGGILMGNLIYQCMNKK